MQKVENIDKLIKCLWKEIEKDVECLYCIDSERYEDEAKKCYKLIKNNMKQLKNYIKKQKELS
jgi:hypothetical protein